MLDPSLVLGARGQQWISRATATLPGGLIRSSTLLASEITAANWLVLRHLRSPFSWRRFDDLGSHEDAAKARAVDIALETEHLVASGGLLAARRTETVDLLVQEGFSLEVRGAGEYGRLLAQLRAVIGLELAESLARRSRYLASPSSDGSTTIVVGDVGRGATR